MVGVFVTPPSSAAHDAGLLYVDATQFQFMCGHGTIAIAMTMVALGMVRRGTIGRTRIRFETLAGTVVAEVGDDGGKVLWTEFENVPAYVAATEIPVELDGVGSLKADVVWGGNYFGVIDISGTNLRIAPENSKALINHGLMAREQIQSKVRIQHPSEQHLRDVSFVTFKHEPTIAGARYKNVHVFGVGQLDRSPGGTATCGILALLESRGELKLNEPMRSEGLLGTGTFEGRLLGETSLNGVRAVRPTVKGTANILGSARWTFDHADPVAAGFLVN